jgi:hypothetical protein
MILEWPIILILIIGTVVVLAVVFLYIFIFSVPYWFIRLCRKFDNKKSRYSIYHDIKANEFYAMYRCWYISVSLNCCYTKFDLNFQTKEQAIQRIKDFDAKKTEPKTKEKIKVDWEDLV